ncbi:MAG: SufD family Fe-S cluster assembly protein [bacterium]
MTNRLLSFLDTLVEKRNCQGFSEFRKESMAAYDAFDQNKPEVREAWRFFDFSVLDSVSDVARDALEESCLDKRCSDRALCDGVLNFSSDQQGEQDFVACSEGQLLGDKVMSVGLPRSVFSYVNSLTFSDLVLLKVEAGEDKGFRELPVMICSTKGMVVSRIHIVLEKGAKATVFLPHRQKGSSTELFHNVFLDIDLDEDAELQVDVVDASLQCSQIETVMVRQQRGSRFVLNTLSYATRMSRRDIHVSLLGENTKTYLNGLAVLSEKQRFYQHADLDHHSKNGQAEQCFKTVLSGTSFCEYSGLVTIQPKAHGCDSSQENPNLLLSDQARVMTRPQLKIDADDVLCGHGSTVGQLDDAHVLYLQSRGLKKQEAEFLLLQGFVTDIYDNFSEDSDLVEDVSAITEQLLSYV